MLVLYMTNAHENCCANHTVYWEYGIYHTQERIHFISIAKYEYNVYAVFCYAGTVEC